jgi:hypothetical protein
MARSIGRESKTLLVKPGCIFLRCETLRQCGDSGKRFRRAILTHLWVGVAEDDPGYEVGIAGGEVVGNKPAVQAADKRRALHSKSIDQGGDVFRHGRGVITVGRAITFAAAAKIGHEDLAVVRKAFRKVTHAFTCLEHAV